MTMRHVSLFSLSPACGEEGRGEGHRCGKAPLTRALGATSPPHAGERSAQVRIGPAAWTGARA